VQVWYSTAQHDPITGGNITYYQCLDLNVKGAQPLPSWAQDYGPQQQATYNPSNPTVPGTIFIPYHIGAHDWDWLIILCVLAFLVLLVAICVIVMCCRKRPQKSVVVPPEPPPPKEEVPVPTKEITPSTSKVSPYAHFAFSDSNDPPSKKDSGSTDRNTGSQGRHFHFHYEEPEPEPAQGTPEGATRT